MYQVEKENRIIFEDPSNEGEEFFKNFNLIFKILEMSCNTSYD